jgi:hypothetical protein
LIVDDEFDLQVLEAIRILLASEGVIWSSALSLVVEALTGEPFSPEQAGKFLRKTRAFRRRRTAYAVVWHPIRGRVERLLAEHNIHA